MLTLKSQGHCVCIQLPPRRSHKKLRLQKGTVTGSGASGSREGSGQEHGICTAPPQGDTQESKHMVLTGQCPSTGLYRASVGAGPCP